MATKSRASKKPAAAIRATSERLGELRRGKGYTVQQFANTFGAKLNTVRDWLNGRGLPRSEAVRDIAVHFEVTTDWLLGIEGAPKYQRQWRTDATLAADLSAYASRNAIQAMGRIPEPWLRELLPTMIYGPTLLAHIVEIVEADLRANAAHFRNQAATVKEIARIETAISTGKPIEAEGILAILKRLAGLPPPPGPSVPWQSVTFRSGPPLLAEQKSPKRARR